MFNSNFNNEELVKLYKETKDKKYLQIIVENNESFIYFCRNYAFKEILKDKNHAVREEELGIEKEDVLQEGYIGLLNAVNKFNEDKEVKFTTYASRCIIGAMMDYVKKEIRYKSKTESLDEDINIEIDSYYILLKYDVENMIKSTLSPLEEKVILLHYGFIEGIEYSIEEINKLLKIENAKYLIQKSLKKLRETDAAKEYKREFYKDKLKAIEAQNINPETKIIKKICFEEILENL